MVGIVDRSAGIDIGVHFVGVAEMLAGPAAYVVSLAVSLLRLLLQPFGLDSHLFGFGLLTRGLRLALAGIKGRLLALLAQVGSLLPTVLLMHSSLAVATDCGDDADHDQHNND